MRKFLRAALAATLLALPLLAAAAAPPKPFTADYELRRNDQVLGVGQISLRALPDGRYELTTRSQGTQGLAALAGLDREERSLMRWTGSQLELLDYSMRQKAAFRTREQSLRLDPASRTVTSRRKDEQKEFPAPEGTLDRHGLTAAIMVALADGRRGALPFEVAGRGGVEAQTYRVAAPVRLRTAIGTERALRVERVRTDGSGRITKLWFARAHGWLPLRIKQYEADGETIDMRITAIR
ncbi:DUF3108 domain-containing protein [Arenimonas caeni]|jgi:hypothetical protein|uniref:DUF3108 domain-containing protein n=1 Tax=Arenimonas caeni TaxID=2058085 RepID=A0A2P6MBS6_9GAMM|nr:DUF3108 domain-containing protein [Arenimonas caeni]MDY0022511.1 DUF3108 domain-containing protein [Arenimonas caeni]PRH83431.1 hypothetical protein C6N40_01920 [Arenimonas caeni]